MTNDDREFLRTLLLRTLAENRTRYGLPTKYVALRIADAGLRGVDRADVEAELEYLLDKEFIVITPNELGPENRQWRIHAKGRDLLALRGF